MVKEEPALIHSDMLFLINKECKEVILDESGNEFRAEKRE
jgi:hypothetical protein